MPDRRHHRPVHGVQSGVWRTTSSRGGLRVNAAEPDHLNSNGSQPPSPPSVADAAGALRDSAYAQVSSPRLSSAPSLLRRLVFAPAKFFWGMAFCQSVTGALAVTGWTYRLMQRSVLKQWWRLSE